MRPLALHDLHAARGATFAEVQGFEVVSHYGDAAAEHAALRSRAVVFDLGFRSRLCLTGADRVAFLHGQVTNDVKALAPGAGCYAALVTARAKMVSDLNLWRLQDELLLDFEPGLAAAVTGRLEKFIVASDVQVLDASPHFGHLSVQGPRAAELLARADLPAEAPGLNLSSVSVDDAALGQQLVMNLPRAGTAGFDIFATGSATAGLLEKLLEAARHVGGRAAGWQALEWARVEAGIPRFGADMDETTLPPEAGIESRAVSYSKGCYAGQEVIARIRTYGQVARRLCGLRLADELAPLPPRGEQLLKDGKEAGFVTTAIASPALKANIALAYVRREACVMGTELTLSPGTGASMARVVALPFA